MEEKAEPKKKKYYLFDCANFPLGRLATRAAFILQGKHKADFSPNKEGSDSILLVNSEKIRTTGRKAENKKYFRFSGYPGGISSKKMGEIMRDNPERILREAIYGMLPKNKLRDKMMKRIKIFSKEEHGLKADLIEEVK